MEWKRREWCKLLWGKVGVKMKYMNTINMLMRPRSVCPISVPGSGDQVVRDEQTEMKCRQERCDDGVSPAGGSGKY